MGIRGETGTSVSEVINPREAGKMDGEARTGLEEKEVRCWRGD